MGFFSKKDHAAKWLSKSNEERAEEIRLFINHFFPAYIRTMHMKQSPTEITQRIDNIKETAENEGWFTLLSDKTTAYYEGNQPNISSNKVIKEIVIHHVNQLDG